jgi:hypothetical protein
MSLRVRRLRLVGVGKSYEVDLTANGAVRPLSVIAGEISTGKTSVLEFVDYCLGAGSHPRHIEIERRVRSALLEVEIDNVVSVIERSTGATDQTATVHRCTIDELAEPHTMERRPLAPPGDPNSLSSFLLSASGSPALNSRRRQHKRNRGSIRSRSVTSWREPVADAPHGHDPSGRACRCELASYAGGVRVYGARRAVRAVAPYVAREFVACPDALGVGGEERQQRVLAAAQLDAHRPVSHDARARVDQQLVVAQGTGAREYAQARACALQCTVYTLQHGGVADDPYIVAVEDSGQGRGSRDILQLHWSYCSFATPPAASTVRGHLVAGGQTYPVGNEMATW